MTSPNFSSDLYSFYRMVETADVFGATQLVDYSTVQNAAVSGSSPTSFAAGAVGIHNFYQRLLSMMIEADARGVYPIEFLMNELQTYASENFTAQEGEAEIPEDKDNINEVMAYAVRAYSTDSTLKMKNGTESTFFQDGYFNGTEVVKIADLKEVLDISEDETSTSGDSNKPLASKLSVVMPTTPLITPQMRNVKKIEFFLNSMPSYFPSRMAPYFDVKFQFARDEPAGAEKKNTAFGLLKFLEGAKLELDGANKAMYDGNFYTNDQRPEGVDKDFEPTQQTSHYRAGMEVFLTPQTLVNPRSDGFEDRYVPVIDPYRPLATLTGAEITIQPQIGFMTYKHGTLSFKIHDRSRLHEISDMIRPQLFKGTTLWITYGWRAPDETHPYAYFINRNMMMREAFMVVNSEFSFDTVGQVDVKLKIATQGARQAEVAVLANNDVRSRIQELERLMRRIQQLRQQLHLSPPKGVKDEVRAYELLDHAARGAVPDMNKDELQKAINGLDQLLSNAAGSGSEFTDAIARVREGLTQLYDPGNGETKEGAFLENLRESYQAQIQDQFEAIETTADPWKMSAEKLEKIKDEVPEWADYGKVWEQYKYAEDPAGALKSAGVFKNRVVSFGKLFSMFVGNAVARQREVDEIQIWYYKLNDHCGPVSGLNIAEFPIEISTFLKAYNDHVISKRSSQVSVKEFVSLLIGTQFGDVRGLGYGMRKFYKPYDPKNRDPNVVKGQQKDLERAVAERQKEYGVFQKPAIQVNIETTHARSDTTGTSLDLLELLQYIDTPEQDKFGGSANSTVGSYKRILRIHVYDKTVDPYPLQSKLLRDKTGTIFSIPPGRQGEAVWNRLMDVQRTFGAGSQEFSNEAVKVIESIAGTADTTPTVQLRTHDVQPGEGGPNVRQRLVEEISKRVPTIVYGANGSTVMQASLQTKSDPRVSTINMIRPVGQQATMEPNGSAVGNLPVRVIPATMQMTSLGCPLAHPAQLYYVEFGTGTTVDNLYILTHITHTFGPGKFETSWQFGYSDGYARYEAMPTIMSEFSSLGKLVEEGE